MSSKRVFAELVRQRAYYAATADRYDVMHVSAEDEHARALTLLFAFARRMDHSSFLDVGAGTGRGVRAIRNEFPDARVVGVEPVAQLRAVGLARGDLTADSLIEGDATALDFQDNAFDWVIETGVLHHIRNFKGAVREMVRVARVGVLISDSNNMGQGALPVRVLKQCIKSAGLWPALIWMQTRGKMYKESTGDGIFDSFSAFDAVPILEQKFSKIYFMNTMPSDGNLYNSASHVAIVAFR